MTAAQRAYAALSGRDPAPPAAARDFLTHVAALAATKLADGLINPKLALAWLLGALGAPAWALGLLVPIREAGALAPQLPLAPMVAAARLRKRLWALASAAQGLAALGIAGAALTLDGAAAVWAIMGCLAVLSLARALGSLSHKDALARTVEKGARGAALGLAATLGAAGAALFAAALTLGWIAPTVAVVAAAVALAGALWLAAAALFLTLHETPQNGEGSGDGARIGHGALLAALRDDAQLRRFIVVRALLTGTALAPPYLVMLSGSLAALGPLLLASAAASVASGYVWGRLSDRSSRRALIATGALGAAVCGAAALSGALTGGLGGAFGAAAAVFALQVAHEGVRGARKVHLTDMSADGDRALNTALSNTAIGLVLLAGGAMGAVATAFGAWAALAAFAAMCACGAALATGLDEAQRG